MKKVILVLSISLIISTFSACKNSTVTESSSESATSKVVAVTTTSGTEKVAETNAVTPETQSQIETSAESVSEKKLNLDLLSDIGLTYGQLKEKYGNISDSRYSKGSHCFAFERSEAYYWFEHTHYLGITEGDVPKDDEKSIAIDFAYAGNIFPGLESTLSASEVEIFYNLNYLMTSFSNMDLEYSSFFTNKDYIISVVTDAAGNVGINNKCYVIFYDESKVTFND